MKFLRHSMQQPFVFATGLAALVHRPWALGTLFAGQQPEGWHLLGWLAPALLIAFALDVGQIVTSAEIRAHGLTIRRGVTFLVFAFATYYLQWLYIAHHMPALQLAEGISPMAKSTATYMRDAALWIIPALLPLSTLLYTFSGQPERQQSVTDTPTPEPERIITLDEPIPHDPIPQLPAPEVSEPIPFGLDHLEQGENESIQPLLSANGHTASGGGRGKKALRNKGGE